LESDRRTRFFLGDADVAYFVRLAQKIFMNALTQVFMALDPTDPCRQGSRRTR
jgi:hypothetical protein